MATRRPASSRSRNPPMAPPQNIPRSRSVLAKPTGQPPSASSTELGESGPSRPTEGGTNIQVVIRCRGRSDKEIQENSPLIVTSNGAKSKELCIETGASVSSLGVVTPPPTRTYPFDLVFGPEADQAMIYHEVVSPMLEQVLQGYNCTLFAYGQTGTGKTYTMQGDLARTPMGNPSSNAGMIPRVLFRLFHQLESSGADYSVKISFVELYNEELRDLLATELSAPSGSTQPMGRGGNAEGGLKIFDEAGKKGVFIQGLEEIAVKNSKDALALLVKGSERRQIASTNFNEHSSRSHSVFSITVHTKDTSFGEDLLKTGKLHLVDLAGSENIGRSGAENKRAREAGMINQSLLTLGRVINALVDKAQHVPYRESKLTRLLQDSLGGRTKTCIIATISPARYNVEETLSTLDYALRAKSIRNKPELNQRMTRNALLKEYVAEIDRLKADLLATREKNGIHLSEESMNQLQAEKEMRRTELVEAKKQVEIIEGKLRNVREEYDQSIGLLMQRDDELKATRSQLSTAQQELAQKKVDLNKAKHALEEEEMVRKAFEESEKVLDGVATGLKSTVEQTTRDVAGLHAKLDRKATVMSSNKKAVSKYGKDTIASAKAVSSSVDGYVSAAVNIHDQLASQAEQIIASERDTLTANLETVSKRRSQNLELFTHIRNDDDAESTIFDSLGDDLQQAQSTFESQLTAWKSTVQDTLQTSCGKIGSAVENHNIVVEQSVDALQAALDTIVQKANHYLEEQQQILTDMKENTTHHANSEIARLRKENAWLSSLVDKERQQAEASKDGLIARISDLLGDFLNTRDASLRQAVGGLQQKHDSQMDAVKTYSEKLDSRFITVAEKSKGLEGSLQLTSREGKRKREAVGEVISSTNEVLSASLGELRGSTSQEMDGLFMNVQGHQRDVSATCSDALEQQTRLKRARIERTNELQANLESDQKLMQSTLSSTYNNLEDFGSAVLTKVSKLEELAGQHQELAHRNIDTLQKTASAVLDKGTRDDQPTGETPQKRQWKYVDEWNLAPSREEIIGARKDEDESAEPVADADVEPEPEVKKSRSSVIEPPPSDPQTLLPRFPSKVPRESRMSMAPPAEALVESRKRNVSTRLRRQV